jgi:hypothetical protein
LEEPQVSRHDLDDGAVGWHEVDRSVHIPLSRIAAEEPRLLRILADRIVREPDAQNRAVTTHFGSAG